MFMATRGFRGHQELVRRHGFTLVELLVVVAILSLLLALLLPSLGKAKYQAKVAVCKSSMRQLTLGLVTYATENNNYYPSTGTIRSNGNPWDQAMNSLDNGVNVRPLIRPYWAGEGSTRTRLEQCTVAPDLEEQGASDHTTSYLFYFNFSRTRFNAPLYSQAMLRVDELFKVNQSDEWGVKTLIADVLVQYAAHPYRNQVVNHHGLNTQFAEHNHWYLRYAYRTPQYSDLYPRASANYALQDGSVVEYTVDDDTTEGFVKTGNQLIPEDHVIYD
jgi:prepilin-type N-terminal cleavage/methylation domain-containing protein